MAETTGMRRTILLLMVVSATVLLASGGVVLAQTTSSPPTFVAKWGSSGTGDGQFNNPQGVATDSSGNVYVADYGNKRIQKFDSDGNFLKQVSADTPAGVAAGFGLVYVVNQGANRLQIYNPDWSGFIGVGGSGTGDGQFNTPYGVAIDSAGFIYVSDVLNHRIQKFDPNGNFLAKWGKTDLTPGNGNGEFSYPGGVATDSSGNVYVAEQGNSRIQKFDSDGNFVAKWGLPGSDDGRFNIPTYVATDSSDNVYVSDYGNKRIQKFDSGGNFLAKWGSSGTGDGQFAGPTGVATDSSGKVYVADSGNNRIQKFAPPVPSAPSTPDLNAASDSGASDTDNITNDKTPTFTGTAEAGSTVKILVDGVEKGSGTAQEYSSTGIPTSELADDSYSVTATATNASGEGLPSDSLSITVDTILPDTTIDTGPSGSTNDTKATFEFSSPESGATFECRLDGTENDYADCSSSKEYTGLSDGPHTFYVRAKDDAGNVDGSPASQSWTVESLLPDAPTITSPQNNSSTTGSFSVKGTAATGSTVELFENNPSGNTSKGTATTASDGSWAIKLSGVSEGQHTYTAKATKAGQTSGASSSLTVTVDTTKPSVSGVTPTSPPRVARSTDVTATFGEDMNSGTLSNSTMKLVDTKKKKKVGASVTYDSVAKTVTLNPTSDLAANRKYQATITTGAKDLAGNGLAKNYTWTFTTGN